jgi:hypothetical protein
VKNREMRKKKKVRWNVQTKRKLAMRDRNTSCEVIPRNLDRRVCLPYKVDVKSFYTIWAKFRYGFLCNSAR